MKISQIDYAMAMDAEYQRGYKEGYDRATLEGTPQIYIFAEYYGPLLSKYFGRNLEEVKALAEKLVKEQIQNQQEPDPIMGIELSLIEIDSQFSMKKSDYMLYIKCTLRSRRVHQLKFPVSILSPFRSI